jgi:hypothetical protein
LTSGHEFASMLPETLPGPLPGTIHEQSLFKNER